MRLRPLHIGWALLGLTLIVLALNLVETPRPAPHKLSALSALRIFFGTPVILLVPGFFFAPLVFGKSIRSNSAPKRLDLGWTLIASVGLNMVFHFLELRLLSTIGGATSLSLNLLTLAIASGGFLLLRRLPEDFSFTLPSRRIVRALAYSGVVLTAVMLLLGPKLIRDSSWYFYNPQLDRYWDGTEEPSLIEVRWADGAEFINGQQFPRRGRIMPFQIKNNAKFTQRVPLVLLLHGPVGTEAWLERLTDPPQASPHRRIATTETMEEGGLKVERYYHWGTAVLTLMECRDDPEKPPYNPNEFCEGVEIPAGELALYELHIRPFEYAWGHSPEDIYIAGWAGLSTPAFQDSLGTLGHQHMHPFQLLNVTENIRWAEELARGEFTLPGRPARAGTGRQGTAIAQPPAWSYLFAPARRLLGEQTAVASALLLSTLLLAVIVGLKGIEDELGVPPPPAVGVVMGFAAVQWGQLMVSDGSINFPDNFYTLALLASVTALVSRRTRVFIMWAALASLLRYPGAVVVGMAGAALFAVAPTRRRDTLDALAQFALVLAAFCGLMLIWGLRSGQLDAWFYSLYWETVPEHFQNNAHAAPLVYRPLIFLLKWLFVGGGILIFAFPFRSVLSRVAVITALGYFPFLAFIDHTSNHYFLPLIVLASLAACASVSQLSGLTRRRAVAALALCSGLLYLGAFRGRSAVEDFAEQIAVVHETIPIGPDETAPTPAEDAPEGQ